MGLKLGLGIWIGKSGRNKSITWSGQTANLTIGAGGHSLASNGGSLSWAQRNVYSQQVTTSGTCRVRFKLTGATPDCDSVLGLASLAKTANDYADIDYAFYRISNDGQINIIENGAFITGIATSAPYLECKIEISAGSVKYYYDNVLVYTSLTAPSGEYKLKASFYNPTAANCKAESITI